MCHIDLQFTWDDQPGHLQWHLFIVSPSVNPALGVTLIKHHSVLFTEALGVTLIKHHSVMFTEALGVTLIKHHSVLFTEA